MSRTKATIEGSEAAAWVAYKCSEVIAIYPITPSSVMGELADAWAAKSEPNLWGTVPTVVEMQSEAGAAGAAHGALTTGALTTTFTASQGLLLMIPNMYKIAGELTPAVFHIAARAVAAQGLSIFGDHGDVMAARSTGWAQLFGNSVQEVMDMALVAHASTLEARIPFLHIFDGFRTSHEINKIERLDEEDVRALVSEELIHQHRARGLTPDAPTMRGTAQNPDVYFQGRESANPYYLAVPAIVQEKMDRLAERTGRHYHLFDYYGAPDAERVIVMMGSGAETVEETIQYLANREGVASEKIGLVKVRLYRPFSGEHLLAALPATTQSIAVLDRTKEPGATGEPLYQDVVTTLLEAHAAGKLTTHVLPKVVGGRYGMGSKDFTPSMVKAVYDNLEQATPRNHFTVGIYDDVTHTSLPFDPAFDVALEQAQKGVVRAIFWGLGSDGTVGANKNSIKIIGEETDNYAEGYFVYDSKKSGGRTTSHLRFGPEPIHATHLIRSANFIGVHQFGFVKEFPVLDEAEEGGVFLLNAPYAADEVWNYLPVPTQRAIIEKSLRFYVIDAYAVARDNGMGNRINTVMQTCFFAISNVLPREEAIMRIKEAIKKTYGKRGEAVVQKNYAAVDATLEHLHLVRVPNAVTTVIELKAAVPVAAPAFVQNVTAPMIAGFGDLLPVSALPADGTWPTGTTQWEKRNIAQEIPLWDPDLCIQCGKCVFVCPHSVIRSKVVNADQLAGAPEGFQSMPAKWRELPDMLYTLQVSVEDCTGCSLCVEVCPAKSKSAVGHKAINMVSQAPIHDEQVQSWEFFNALPEPEKVYDDLGFTNVKNIQLLEPTFEFSLACSGCGETPYLKLMSQLFGDRTVIANATGCSSIYGGNLPTTPWTTDRNGRGPAWSNSLFEDNAEFGLGMRVNLDKQMEYAAELLVRLQPQIGDALVNELLENEQSNDVELERQRVLVEQLKQALAHTDDPRARDLLSLADKLVKKSVWIVGGDGWAYDIGFGGLDHVLASGRNVNILVLDTEVYSNTGGQSSKSTPRGAVAKFAAGGKRTPKKDLGMMAISYGGVYVAKIAMGANDGQTVKAFLEAESYDGPSLIIAYSHCIAHGINMAKGLEQQNLATQSGHWPLYRFDPRLVDEGKNGFQLDSKEPKVPLKEYIYNETRYNMLTLSNPTVAEELLQEAQSDVAKRWSKYKELASA